MGCDNQLNKRSGFTGLNLNNNGKEKVMDIRGFQVIDV